MWEEPGGATVGQIPSSCHLTDAEWGLLRADPRYRLGSRSEEHTSELQSPCNLVCRLLLEKKKIHKTAHGHRGETARTARPRARSQEPGLRPCTRRIPPSRGLVSAAPSLDPGRDCALHPSP